MRAGASRGTPRASRSGVATGASSTASRAGGNVALSEKQWQQTVADYAKLRGWHLYHSYDSRRSEPGFPDLVLLRGRRQVVAELKTDAAPGPTPDQQKWLQAFADVGAEVHVWRPRDLQLVLSVLA